MKWITFTMVMMSYMTFGQSSISIQSPTAEQTIEKIVRSLEGEGVIIQNIKTNQIQSSNQIGTFSDDRSSLGMSTGLIMSSGSVENASGANTSGSLTGAIQDNLTLSYDTIVSWQPCASSVGARDLTHAESVQSTTSTIQVGGKEIKILEDGTKLCKTTSYVLKKKGGINATSDSDLKKELGGAPIFDACVVELDIIPLGDTLNFTYLFASEEYDEYVCSAFNDAFAFYLSGPGIEGKKNLAVLDNGDRVSVNSINNGNPQNKNCEPSNPTFYQKNEGKVGLEYDGMTRNLEIIERVEPFKKYHLKLVIADVSDDAYDSGVFVESQSVISYDHKYVIPFDSDISKLDADARSILVSLSKIAKEHPEYKLQITGHTDGDGSEEYNMVLAESRIESIVQFLIENEGDRENYILINKGETMPIASNFSEEGKKENRRVEIKLIPSMNGTIQMSENTDYSNILMQTFPNPASSYSKVEIESDITIENGVIQVYSIKGERLAEQELERNTTTFNTSDWNPGMYLYTLVIDGESIQTKRMVISH